MKNLLIFISPSKSFNNPRPDLINDAGVSVKIQIENSLQLGWRKEDIMLVTNFNYEYAGIRAEVLDDVAFFERKPQASKINALLKLFENGMIKSDEIYWFHDLDAFQVCSIPELKIDLGTFDMALTDYGRNDRWSTGVIYFKISSRDIFVNIRDVMYKNNIDEERALTHLTRTNEEINKRVKKINKSFNFTPRNLKTMYALALKPIRVIHFHPLGAVGRRYPQRAFYFFKGENSLHIQFITDRLLKIFRFHRIR
ncbi:hypothetical protein HYW44_04725 [Candidatus Daviesbacteria bacterium]|nr:hypothetical protein [Candidatus Daviesbacteria bacterium]